MGECTTDLARRFRFDDGFLAYLLQGLDGADRAFRPEGGGNAIHWILGHLAVSRRDLARMLGAEVAEEEWEALFRMGVEPGADEAWPPEDDLAAGFRNAGEAFATRLDAMTPEEAARPRGHEFPGSEDTTEGAASFFLFHEVYHLGQIGLIRRMRGKERFA